MIPEKKIRKISQRWKTPEPRKEKRWVLQSRSLTVPVQDKGLVTQGSEKKEMEGREEKGEGQTDCKGHPGHEAFSYSDNS